MCVSCLRLGSFARSFISLADNAVELQASLAPEEADQWCCAWEKGKVMDWDTYMYTGISGTTAQASSLVEL